ncbi:Atu4866 domain-containing protein [Catenuloplanes atrovinosus]|uniref:Adenine deaminase n=1 Tax=Catenuloplanes atrovinosus TaxID=137266 RepID=A0AAE3YRH9_9ACTN|nr:Atu4866 domain-containing protein [Catenuloplanes atrovinosus]MDR7277321.1 adenine deaminase [Catenuloplanes atrovinosus]
MTTTVSARIDDRETLDALTHTTGVTRPVLLTGGRVRTLDAMIGEWAEADVLLGGDRIVGVGPGLITAAGDDNAIVVECRGGTVLPALIDLAAPLGSRKNRFDTDAGSITPGKRADIVVLRPNTPADRFTADDIDIMILAGRVVFWRGEPVGEPPATTPADPSLTAGDHDYAGMWVDETGFLHQELLPNGRYDETRGGRPHAYQGRYWINGDRIDYLDDLGFWAFGEFRDGVLHHAGYVLHRR